MRKELIQKIKADIKAGIPLLTLSKETGIPYCTIWRMLHGHGETALSKWERVARYYSKRNGRTARA